MSGTNGALRLIELTSARLCHDISGMVGMLEHARGSADNVSPASNVENVGAGATQALTTRLDLRRAAWGPDGDSMTLGRIQRLADGLPERITVNASALDKGSVFSASAARIVLNLLLLAADSLPSGGTVILAGESDDLFVRIAGPAAAWPIGMAVCMSDETEARSALTDGRNLQLALTALLAHAAGIRLSVMFPPSARAEPAILRLGG